MIRPPRSDDRRVHDIALGIIGYPAVLVAHDLGLYARLAEAPRPLGEVAAALGLARRPAEALLSVSTALGLVRLEGGRYALTPLAEDYLLPDSPTSFTGYFDLMIANWPLYSFESLKKAVLTDSPQAYGGGDPFKAHEARADAARVFTRGMHGRSMAPALAWPGTLDLSRHRRMLDVGGGSGAHAIGAALRWPELRATVLDIAPVCALARESAARAGLADRIGAQAGDFWRDPFPAADLHFYSTVFHDWPPDRCAFLARKSFESLPSGGRLIVHEMLYDDDRTGPFPMAAANITMLLWTEGQQYSGRELSGMLRDAGFTQVEARPTFGYWSIVTGRKP
jgi:SAM-dependent methyltransferase